MWCLLAPPSDPLCPEPCSAIVTPPVPGSVVSRDVHRLSREEAVFNEDVNVLAELRQPAAAAGSGQVKQRQHQGCREALQTLPGPPLALHRLQVGEARPSRQSAAPHQTVTQDGPLEELTADRKSAPHHELTTSNRHTVH